jgi:hypothetical protein
MSDWNGWSGTETRRQFRSDFSRFPRFLDEKSSEIWPGNHCRTAASFGRRLSRTCLCWHSNRSLLGRENSTGKRFGEARDWRGTFGVTGPIPGGRDHAISRLRQQSDGKSKTIPTAPGNRNCVRLRGGPGRTRTCNQAVMSRVKEGFLAQPSGSCFEITHCTAFFFRRT